MALKVHRATWSGRHPENSLAGIRECLREGVARAEIDMWMLGDGNWAVSHDAPVATSGGTRLPLLSEVVAEIRAHPGPTIFEIDAKDVVPWPWQRVQELAAVLDPVRDRVVVAGEADWNIRALARVDPDLPVGFNPSFHLDWTGGSRPHPLTPPPGPYGYRDAAVPPGIGGDGPAAYLRRRWEELLALVPGSREIHLRLGAFERMLEDGFTELPRLVHASGMQLDVWTLNGGTPDWEARLARVVAAGVDMVTTDTPRALAAAAARFPDAPTAVRRRAVSG